MLLPLQDLRFSKHRKVFVFVLLALAFACPALADDTRGGRLERKREADLLATQARDAFLQGRYGDVLSPGTSALSLYEALEDEAGEADVLHDLGRAQRKLANYQEAARWHQRALDLALRSGDRARQGTALIDLGDVHERRKDHPGAISRYRKALEIFRLPEDWKEAGRALRQIGDIYVVRGEFEDAYDASGSGCGGDG